MFKIYKNRKTNHPSISLKSGDKYFWHNLELTHHPVKKHSFIEIDDPNPNSFGVAYVRRYIRKDKHKCKGFRYKKYKVSLKSECKIKFLVKEYKKR